MTDWMATATALVDGTPWTLFEMADGTWFATLDGFTYFVPFTVSSTTSTTALTSSTNSDQLPSSVTASFQHARILAIIFGIIGGIFFMTILGYMVWRVRHLRQKHWDGQLCIQVERAVTSDPSPCSPPLMKDSSLLRWVSKSSRADTMDLPIQMPPACLLERSKPSTRHRDIFSFGDSAGMSIFLSHKRKAKTITPYLIMDPSTTETEQKRMSIPVIQIQRSESIDLPPYPPPTYVQSTVSHLDLDSFDNPSYPALTHDSPHDPHDLLRP